MHPQDILMYGHRTVLRTVGSFPKEKTGAPGALGYWSVKDVVAHLASFELVLVEALANMLEPCPTPLVDEYKAGGQAFNDRQVDQLRKGLTMEEALREYTVAHEKARALAGRIAKSSWQQPGILPWYGAQYDLEDFVVYTFYAHKREHCGQIDVFHDRLKGD